MEEPSRLVCPKCDLVYRLKKITPGRVHVCKNCGTALQSADLPAGGAPAGAAPAPAARAEGGTSDLARLPKLIENLAARLDAIQESGDADGAESPVTTLLETVARIEEEMKRARDGLGERIHALDERVDSALDAGLNRFAGDIAERLSALDEKITAVAGHSEDRPKELALLRDTLESGRAELLRLLEEQHASRKREMSALLPDAGKTTFEVDIDELADRLVAGVRGRSRRPLGDDGTDDAVDALAKLADQLVREQSANTARLDRLATEIHGAIDGIAKIEEWRGELPDRVADEIGATVEARVVGPISGALARQAPSILSDLQDSKLVDIVSRSIREAQRPLLREILAGGRNGVPVWLFASVLLPLLLILGYLFLPGEAGGYGAAGIPAGVSESLARIEGGGVALSAETEERLGSIEEAVLDIHNQALAHVKNAAALEEEVRNLRRRLEERDAMIAEYTTTLERQTKRIQAYELRLVQLGVKPDAVAGQ